MIISLLLLISYIIQGLKGIHFFCSLVLVVFLVSIQSLNQFILIKQAEIIECSSLVLQVSNILVIIWVLSVQTDTDDLKSLQSTPQHSPDNHTTKMHAMGSGNPPSTLHCSFEFQHLHPVTPPKGLHAEIM